MNAPLRFDAVHAAYKKREIIRGVSLSARRGQMLALIGPNGAGKSTLLRLAAGFLGTRKGRVLIDGNNVNGLAPYQRARLGVGYLMQGGRVFPSLTVAENLSLAARGLMPDERAESVGGVTEAFNLREVLGVRAGTLSGGTRQRVALALVLVKRPPILLLDEPSAGLSPVVAQGVFKTLNRWRQIHQAAILLVEQNVQLALRFAQRAVMLVDGKIAAETKRPEAWLVEGTFESFFLGQTPEASP